LYSRGAVHKEAYIPSAPRVCPPRRHQPAVRLTDPRRLARRGQTTPLQFVQASQDVQAKNTRGVQIVSLVNVYFNVEELWGGGSAIKKLKGGGGFWFSCDLSYQISSAFFRKYVETFHSHFQMLSAKDSPAHES